MLQETQSPKVGLTRKSAQQHKSTAQNSTKSAQNSTKQHKTAQLARSSTINKWASNLSIIIKLRKIGEKRRMLSFRMVELESSSPSQLKKMMLCFVAKEDVGRMICLLSHEIT